MKKTLLFLIIASMMWVLPLYAADTKITELTEDTAPTSDDLVPTVNAPGTSPANRKATLANLFKWALVPGGATNVTTITGNYAFGITLTDTTNVTFPTSGTLATTTDISNIWSGSITDEQLACTETTGGTNQIKSCGATPTFIGDVTLDDGLVDSPALIFKDGADETATLEKVNGEYLRLTTLAADGLRILTGNMKIGNETPTHTPDGEDLYVEGFVEVDGMIYADGGITGALTGNADTATALATLGTANQLYGMNAAGTAGEWKSTINILLDDSAAQFKSATAGHLGLFKIDLSGSTTDKTRTIVSSHTDDRSNTIPDVAGDFVMEAADNIFTGANTIGDGGDDIRVVTRVNASNGTWSGNALYFAQCAASLAFGTPVYIQSTGKPAAADADAAATMPAIGLIVVASTDADTPCTVLTHGTITNTSWNWGTVGGYVYASETAGATPEETIGNISDTNDVVQVLGIVLHADTLFVNPSLTTIVLE